MGRETQVKIPGAQWIPDSEASECSNPRCKERRPFGTLMNRRHHCRWCGKIFCNECAQITPATGGLRRCNACAYPHVLLPLRLPVWRRPKPAEPASPRTARDEAGTSDEAVAAANKGIKGTRGSWALGRFQSACVEQIFSFLTEPTLNAVLQSCRKAQSHFHVNDIRYETEIRELYPSYCDAARVGDGAGGVVFKVQNPRASLPLTPPAPQFVAVKVVRKSIQFGYSVWRRLKAEVELQRCIEHPSVARLLDVFQTPDEVVLIIEAGDGGSLRKAFDVLRTRPNYIPLFTAHCLYQCADALIHLRARNVAHRDIKCDNIVLSDDFSRVMMIDFGLAERVKSDAQKFTPCGTVGFASAENIDAVVLNSKQKREGIEGPAFFMAGMNIMSKADVFSLGVVAYMMLSSTKPFKSNRFAEMHDEVHKGLRCAGKYWDRVDPQARQLVEAMLRADHATRLSPEQIMADPWVREAKDRFQDVVRRRREELASQDQKLQEEWDIPKIERVGDSSVSSILPLENGQSPPSSAGCWAVEGAVLEIRFRHTA
jgi:serine/threonine protein kinase